VVGRKPQDGWCPWLATLGYTDSSVIKTVQRPSSLASCPERVPTNENGDAQDGRARQNVSVAGEEKAVKRKPAHVTPVGSKGPFEVPGAVEPQERSGDETSPAWFRAEQDVERVRNPVDVRCRRLDPSDIRTPDSVERCRGRNPRRGALASAGRCG